MKIFKYSRFHGVCPITERSSKHTSELMANSKTLESSPDAAMAYDEAIVKF